MPFFKEIIFYICDIPNTGRNKINVEITPRPSPRCPVQTSPKSPPHGARAFPGRSEEQEHADPQRAKDSASVRGREEGWWILVGR